MYLRKVSKYKDGKAHRYWALVQSYRTERGPRQRTGAWLGEVAEDSKLVLKTQESTPPDQRELFAERAAQWVEVNTKTLRVEDIVEFGGPWRDFAAKAAWEMPLRKCSKTSRGSNR